MTEEPGEKSPVSSVVEGGEASPQASREHERVTISTKRAGVIGVLDIKLCCKLTCLLSMAKSSLNATSLFGNHLISS